MLPKDLFLFKLINFRIRYDPLWKYSFFNFLLNQAQIFTRNCSSYRLLGSSIFLIIELLLLLELFIDLSESRLFNSEFFEYLYLYLEYKSFKKQIYVGGTIIFSISFVCHTQISTKMMSSNPF